jgi:hypothetical protein
MLEVKDSPWHRLCPPNAHHHPPETSHTLVAFSASGRVHDVVRSRTNWPQELLGQTTSSCNIVHVEASC